MYYYGQTYRGLRIHMGNFVLKGRGRREVVYTFCGNEMLSWDEGERPPYSQVEEFCRNCFRTYAWEIMQGVVSAQVVTDLLEIFTHGWPIERIEKEIEAIALKLFQTAEVELPEKRPPAGYERREIVDEKVTSISSRRNSA